MYITVFQVETDKQLHSLSYVHLKQLLLAQKNAHDNFTQFMFVMFACN